MVWHNNYYSWLDFAITKLSGFAVSCAIIIIQSTNKLKIFWIKKIPIAIGMVLKFKSPETIIWSLHTAVDSKNWVNLWKNNDTSPIIIVTLHRFKLGACIHCIWTNYVIAIYIDDIIIGLVSSLFQRPTQFYCCVQTQSYLWAFVTILMSPFFLINQRNFNLLVY